MLQRRSRLIRGCQKINKPRRAVMTYIVSHMPCRGVPPKMHHCVKYWPKAYHHSFCPCACFTLRRSLLNSNNLPSFTLFDFFFFVKAHLNRMYFQCLMVLESGPEFLSCAHRISSTKSRWSHCLVPTLNKSVCLSSSHEKSVPDNRARQMRDLWQHRERLEVGEGSNLEE